MSRLLKNSILLIIVILNILGAILNIPHIILKFSYTKSIGIVQNTYTQFSFFNIGYDSMVTFNYENNQTCFYRTCFGCPTYQIANLTSFSYKLNDQKLLWINNKNSQDCYPYDMNKTEVKLMPLLFVIFDFILITLFCISMIVDFINLKKSKKEKKDIKDDDIVNPL